MEVKTVYGIMDIHTGAIFAEVYGSISRLRVVIIWEVISEPEVEEYSDGSKFISWLSRNTKTGEEKKIGINDHAFIIRLISILLTTPKSKDILSR